MKKPKKVNRTFSIPQDVAEELHTFVKRREMSQFVTDAIRKELLSKKEELKKAYLSSNQDEGQFIAMDDWKGTLQDGSNEW